MDISRGLVHRVESLDGGRVRAAGATGRRARRSAAGADGWCCSRRTDHLDAGGRRARNGERAPLLASVRGPARQPLQRLQVRPAGRLRRAPYRQEAVQAPGPLYRLAPEEESSIGWSRARRSRTGSAGARPATSCTPDRQHHAPDRRVRLRRRQRRDREPPGLRRGRPVRRAARWHGRGLRGRGLGSACSGVVRCGGTPRTARSTRRSRFLSRTPRARSSAGRTLRTVYVTSARHHLSDEQLAAEPWPARCSPWSPAWRGCRATGSPASCRYPSGPSNTAPPPRRRAPAAARARARAAPCRAPAPR